ncbi:hypothetical protein BOTBODRAFT_188638 [Botryobasidium botryosum FD-172 SS1]|uniref:HNH nuclease domain-containing protein n=1 Tax=Botryobasidium botryosum (strain FD-172 SS1) TaxID=930990 RepID=A0A067MCD0_BOTB1|nr:hypothetical protein BOTBODRAFT_188638 [Botryobasidium botryosum FD-172 SS1]
MSLETAKAKVEAYQDMGAAGDRTKRILQALMLYAPTELGRQNMIMDVNSCDDDVQLKALADRYLTGLIIPFKTMGGRTPAVSDHPTAPDADNAEQKNQGALQVVHREGKLKDRVLQRDNYRCVITGVRDPILAHNPSERAKRDPPFLHTIAAHIVPFSFAPKSESAAKIVQSSKIFEAISRFGGYPFIDELGGNINRLENVFTLTGDMHTLFGNLEMWLEPVEGNTNTYRIGCVPHFASALPYGPLITTYIHGLESAPA